jgi:predicted Zn-dependent protease
MAMDLNTFRKLVSLDPEDPLSRFALGKKLAEVGQSNAELEEAVEHLTFANQKSPGHLATYHVLGGLLVRLGRKDEARRILSEGIPRVGEVGGGMGHDLGPAMQHMLEDLDKP